MVGFTMKIFTAISARLAEDNRHVLCWRFSTTNIFAYFYVALVFISMFTSSGTGVFALTVANLYNIFMIIYAYIGFNFALASLSVKMKPVVAFLLIIVAVSLLASFAVSLLSMLGVFFTLRNNGGPQPVE